MLHIILTILKIIGILILVILALLLVIIGVVLFVPIRYRVNGKKDAESLYIKAEVYWLLHLFRLKAVYPEPGQVIAKILWFTVYDSKKEDNAEKSKKEKKQKAKKEKTKKKDKKKDKKKEKTDFETKEFENKEVPQNKTDRLETKSAKIESAGTESTKIESMKTEGAESESLERILSQETEQETEQEEPKKGKIREIIDKIKALIQKVLDIFKNIRYTIGKFCDKIKEIWANIQYYAEVLKEDETKRAFLMCKQQLYKIWKNIRPSKLKAKLKIGTGQPDTTGYILAVHGMLYPLIGNNVFIEPDFENQVYEGTIFIKGRITVFVLLWAAIKLYFDEDIKHFLKRIKREEEVNGR